MRFADHRIKAEVDQYFKVLNSKAAKFEFNNHKLTQPAMSMDQLKYLILNYAFRNNDGLTFDGIIKNLLAHVDYHRTILLNGKLAQLLSKIRLNFTIVLGLKYGDAWVCLYPNFEESQII